MTSSRVERLQANLAQRGLDAMLVMQPENRRYISGFTGSAGAAFITVKTAYFVTDFRYTDQAGEQCQGYEVITQTSSILDTVSDLVKTTGAKRIGFEQEFMSYGEVERYRAVEAVAPGVQLVATEGVVEALRIIKDAGEIALIQKAADIAAAGFDHILGYMKPGLAERDVAIELETFMRKQGAEGAAFSTIVASGWRSSLPHGRASEKLLEDGDYVTLDFGARYQGYISDITRTVVIGKPSDKQTEIYHIVLEAQERALAAADVGMTGAELDAVGRDYIAAKGYGDNFGHGLGHGIGLAVHENPGVRRGGKEVLQTGMIFTVEPGIYISGWGGVRIEDDIALFEDGKRIITSGPKFSLISL